MAKNVDSKEVGLEISYLLTKFFFRSQYIHYGYFSDGLEVHPGNLGEAQQRYTDLIFSYIPEGVKTILDVGCGAGKNAFELLKKGYDVDCVSPAEMLNKYAKELIGDKGNVYSTTFEKFETEKKYDLIMFSESFQYIPIDDSIPQALKYLNEGGHILFGDFFRKDIPGKHPMGGGHELKEWEQKLPTFPLEVVAEKDITEETAKTFDVVNQLTTEFIQPVWKSVYLLLQDRFPTLVKIVSWKYKKKFEKIGKKHFTGQRNGANFKKHKKYIICLLKAK